jgi:hypothetical protein
MRGDFSMTDPKSYIIYLIGIECYNEFIKWAFGEGFKEDVKLGFIPDLWTKMHPEYPMSLNDSVTASCDKMIDLWFESRPSIVKSVID